MKKSSFFARLSLLISSAVVIGGITFGVKYEYKQVDAWSGTQTSNAPSNYYSSCEGKEGSALQSALLACNKPVSTSYDWSRYEAEDEAEDDSSSILCVYTRHNIAKNSHCGSYSWTTWNREHVWTQTLYPESKTDNHNIFACEGQINNYRGNMPYGEVEHTATNTKDIFGHKIDCYWTSSYFEPCDEAKGEIARSVMYGTVMYSRNMTLMFKNIETALKWHIEHPVTNRDIFRNNTAYKLQGNRNPFVDNPSYACKIWGNTNAATKALCGNGSTEEKTLTSVVVSNVKSTLKFNEQFTAKATAVYSDGTSLDVTNTATWKTSDSTIVTVDKGLVTSQEKEGSAVISATYESKTGTASVTVENEEVSPEVTLVSVDISSKGNEIAKGKSMQLTAKAVYSDGNEIDVTNEAIWKTDNVDVAMVYQGEVAAVEIGDVTISATYSGVTGSIDLSVVDKLPAVVVGISLECEYENKIPVNKSIPMTAFANYDDGTKVDVTNEAIWKSSDDTIAMVYQGEVATCGLGTVTITATYNGFTNSLVFEVCEKVELPDNETPTDEGNKSSGLFGCKGSIGSTSIILSGLAIVGLVLVSLKKKND